MEKWITSPNPCNAILPAPFFPVETFGMDVDTWWNILYFRTLPVKNQALGDFISVGGSCCKRETLGPARPQTPRQGIHPLHLSRRFRPLEIKDKFRLPRWGDEKFEGFWPKKAREHPRGKFISPTDDSLAFPGCKASGLASIGRRARSHTASSQTSAFLQGTAGTMLA